MDDLNWMNPINKLVWIKAFRAKRKTVTLPKPDGREFTLRYDLMPGKVLVNPVKGFAPMGWFDLERVTDDLWISEEAGDVTSRVRPDLDKSN